MALPRYSDDSDSDLPELDELINRHVRGLNALNAPKLNASKSAAARLSPRKITEKASKLQEDCSKTSAPAKSLSTAKLSSRQPLELKAALVLEKPRSKPKPLLKPRAQSTQKKEKEVTEESKSRATPHRRAKPASYRLPRIEDSESEENEETIEEDDVEESIWCESEKEDDEPQVLAPPVLNKPTRRLVPRRTTPDVESSDSDEDVFHTPPSKQQKPFKTVAPPQASDDLAQQLLRLGLDDSDKENDNGAILKLYAHLHATRHFTRLTNFSVLPHEQSNQ